MRTVRSRVLLGVGAWLLGATSATAGSLYAVGQLGNSLLAVSTKQMSVEMVNSDLAQENSRHPVPLPSSTQPSGPRHIKKSATPGHSASPGTSSSAGTLLTSPDGSAEAVCTTSGAYLSYWSPQPGFEVDDVVRGPAAVASVIFRGASGGIKMNVSCDGGVPVKRLVNAGWSDRPHDQ
jgi:hypothetical protein